MEATPTIDQLETELLSLESQVSRCRRRQLTLLRALDEEAVAALDGSRSFVEWTASRLDVTHDSARVLVRTAHNAERAPLVLAEMEAGAISFERAAATIRLAAGGADERTVADSRGLDLAGVHRLAARRRRIGHDQERRTFSDRFVSIQPSLDQSMWRMWGQLPGYEGSVVAKALADRGDRLSADPSDAMRPTRQQRSADALVTMAMDSLGGADGATASDDAAPLVAVFVDAELAASTGGEAGVELAAGPRVGPETLERLLCEGRVEVTTTGAEPLAVGHATRAVPPRLRRFVLHRDGGCVADGCQSRYRLQAHHVLPASRGGPTDPDNLVTLCWYHHHVVVHGQGRSIDPASPRRRMRFLRPQAQRAPPVAA